MACNALPQNSAEMREAHLFAGTCVLRTSPPVRAPALARICLLIPRRPVGRTGIFPHQHNSRCALIALSLVSMGRSRHQSLRSPAPTQVFDARDTAAKIQVFAGSEQHHDAARKCPAHLLRHGAPCALPSRRLGARGQRCSNPGKRIGGIQKSSDRLRHALWRGWRGADPRRTGQQAERVQPAELGGAHRDLDDDVALPLQPSPPPPAPRLDRFRVIRRAGGGLDWRRGEDRLGWRRGGCRCCLAHRGASGAGRRRAGEPRRVFRGQRRLVIGHQSCSRGEGRRVGLLRGRQNGRQGAGGYSSTRTVRTEGTVY